MYGLTVLSPPLHLPAFARAIPRLSNTLAITASLVTPLLVIDRV